MACKIKKVQDLNIIIHWQAETNFARDQKGLIQTHQITHAKLLVAYCYICVHLDIV